MPIYTISLSQVRSHKELIENSNSLLITRSNRPYSSGLKSLGVVHETRLAPSWDLYNKAQNIKTVGDFDNWYDSVYTVTFIKGLKEPGTIEIIKQLSEKLKKGEDTVLICFCTKDRCHKHILADILSRLSHAEIINL